AGPIGCPAHPRAPASASSRHLLAYERRQRSYGSEMACFDAALVDRESELLLDRADEVQHFDRIEADSRAEQHGLGSERAIERGDSRAVRDRVDHALQYRIRIRLVRRVRRRSGIRRRALAHDLRGVARYGHPVRDRPGYHGVGPDANPVAYLNLSDDLRAGRCDEVVADYGAIAGTQALPDQVRVNEGAMRSDHRRRPDRDSVGVIDDQPGAARGAGGNLCTGES